MRGRYAITSKNYYIDLLREFTSLFKMNEVETDMNFGVSCVFIAGNRVPKITEEDQLEDEPHNCMSSMWVQLELQQIFFYFLPVMMIMGSVW